MPDIAADIRLMLANDFGETATLAGGVVVNVDATVATAEDAFGGDGIIAGQTLVLTVATADVPGIKARSLLTFRGQAYGVNHRALRAQGHLTKLFLGTP